MKVLFLIALVVFLICAVDYDDKMYQNIKKIKIAVKQFHGKMHINSTENEIRIVGGRDFDILKILMSAYGISFDLMKPAYEVFGRRMENGTWNGLIGSVVRNEVDMSLPGALMNYERYQDLGFSIPFNYIRLKFIVHSPKRQQAWAAIFKPFTLMVWIVLASSLLFYGVSSFIILRTEFSLYGKPIPFSIRDLYWCFFESLINQGSDSSITEANTPASRFILIMWSLATLVLTSSYSGVIMSIMFNPPLTEVPTTFSQLAEAVEAGKYSCGTLKKSALYLAFQGKKTSVGRRIGDHLERNPSNSFTNFKKSIIRVLKEDYASIMGERQIQSEKQTRNGHHLFESKDAFVTFCEAYPLRKGFVFKKKLDKVLRRLFEAGIIRKLENDAFARSFPVHQQEKGYRPLMIEDLLSPLLLLVFGYFLSTLCLISELILKSMQNYFAH